MFSRLGVVGDLRLVSAPPLFALAVPGRPIVGDLDCDAGPRSCWCFVLFLDCCMGLAVAVVICPCVSSGSVAHLHPVGRLHRSPSLSLDLPWRISPLWSLGRGGPLDLVLLLRGAPPRVQSRTVLQVVIVPSSWLWPGVGAGTACLLPLRLTGWLCSPALGWSAFRPLRYDGC